MKECTVESCPLYSVKKQVPYRGNVDSQVVIVGESPGRVELAYGKPFVGPAGNLLTKSLSDVGFDPESMFYTNSAMCRIDKDALSVKEINEVLRCCRPNLELALSIIKPKLIIVLGEIAMRQVLKLSNIGKRRGSFVWSPEFECWALVAYHPAFCLRNMSQLPTFAIDLSKGVEFIKTDGESLKNAVSCQLLHKPSFEHIPSGAVALDTETQGLNWLDPNCTLLSYSFCASEHVAYHVPLLEPTDNPSDAFIHVHVESGRGKKAHDVEVHLKKSANFNKKLDFLYDVVSSDSIKKYMFNGMFDILFIESFFKRVGRKPPKVRNYVMDVQAAAHLIDENVFLRGSLEQARKILTSFDSQYSSDFDAKYDKNLMASVPPEEMMEYACLDAYVTFCSALKLRSLLIEGNQRQLNYYCKFVIPTIQNVLPMLTRNGAMVDLEKIPDVKEVISSKLIEERSKVLVVAPPSVVERHGGASEVKLSKTSFIRDCLFASDGFGLEPTGVTLKGTTNSVDAKSRASIKQRRGTPKRAIQFIQHYENWCELSMLLSRYIKNFEAATCADGRLHPRYSIVTTVTGRTSTSDPSLQNVPTSGAGREMRRLIISSPGMVLMAFDQSQAELRWMAHLSQDERMLETYRSNGDIHTTTALAMLGKSRDEVSDDEFKAARRSAKAQNFGLIYGMSPGGFRQYAAFNYGIFLSEREAFEMHSNFFKLYSGIKRYHEKITDECDRFGMVVSPFGRTRLLPGIWSPDQGERARAIRQALNHPIQSASSDTVLVACNQMIESGMFDNQDEIRLIMFIHDELIFECREDKVSYYKPLIKRAMENPPLEELFGVKMLVPFIVGCKIGKNYGDLVEDVA